MNTKTLHSLQLKYREEVVPALMKEFKLENVHQVPTLQKVVVSVGIGNKEPAKQKAIESMSEQLKIITGQLPKKTTAKKSIAGFSVRQGDPLGLVVTLRGDRMWQFFDKLIRIVLPRFKDFQGVSKNSFDLHGNYNIGVQEQIVFPEVDYDTIDRIRGLQINLVTSSKDKDQAYRLLELLGLPFERKLERAK